MKRSIYIALCIITLVLLGYTVYYAATHATQAKAPEIPVATTTEVMPEDKSVHTTKDGKKIKLVETNPVGQSLSTITITPSGFSTDTPIVLEVNKMTNALYADLNNDGFEELVITTMAQGSGSYGEVYMYTTASATQLLPVSIPELKEDDTKVGALFEGYMGHDSFTIKNNELVREFPTYLKNDVMSDPTGPTRSIVYTLIEKNGEYSVALTQGTSTPALIEKSTSTSPQQ